MTQQIATHDGTDRVLEVLVSGNLSVLTAPERLDYYNRLCESLQLNPLTKPFEFLTLNGKLVLYALKGCTDQLRQVRGVSISEPRIVQQGDLYIVTVSATDANGRLDSDMGVVSTKNLSGENLANAMLKAVTKAKRRVTLSICGLGMLDESEISDIPAASKRPPVVMPGSRIAAPTSSGYIAADPETGEIIDAPIVEKPASEAVIASFIVKASEKGYGMASVLAFAEWDAVEGHTRAELETVLKSLPPKETASGTVEQAAMSV